MGQTHVGLAILDVPGPSERFYATKPRAHKKPTDWGRQTLAPPARAGVVKQLRRWLPDRRLVIVADSSFAAISWLFGLTQLPGPLCLIVRFRLDAALYAPAPQRTPGTQGRPRKKGDRLPTLKQVAENKCTKWQRVTIPDWYGERRRPIEIVSNTAVWFHNGQPALLIRWVLIRDPKGKFTLALAGSARETQALLSTDQTITPEQIVKGFNLRWQIEVTFHEVRTHLGVETQRQWSNLAIMRTTPALLALFSIVRLIAHQHAQRRKLPIRQTAWYHKTQPTCSDALALVRRQIWQRECFPQVSSPSDSLKGPSAIQERLLSALCYTP